MRNNIPNSYASADAFLKGKDCRKVASKRATEVQRLTEDIIALYYHGTAVVLWYANGKRQIFNGGHRTVTTKRRINDAVPGAVVWQRNFEWWVSIGKKNPVPFQDGMIF